MSKTILITGANRGIGLELAKQFKAKNHHVIALCRHSSPEIENIADQVINTIDCRNQQDLIKAKAACKATSIDILINNAGILRNESLGAIHEQAINQIKDQFLTNSLAPLMVTEHFLPLLKTGSKVILITSRMGSIADNDSGSRYGYRMSKAALNAAGKSLSIDLKDQGIAVGILHPGWVQTEMTGYSGPMQPQESAQNLCCQIEKLNLNNSGHFFHANGEALPW